MMMMSPKPRNQMTPEELRAEKEYQEKHFEWLVSHIEEPEPEPSLPWYSRWWNSGVGVVVKMVMYFVVFSIIVAIVKALVGF